MPDGSPLPNTASTPRAKAMSVAVGIGQPRAESVPAANDEEDRDRDDHAAGRGDRRLQRLARGVELAARQLELQLDRDDEEEDRQQAVLDPVPDRHLEDARDADVRLLECDDARPERRVRDDEREDRPTRAGRSRESGQSEAGTHGSFHRGGRWARAHRRRPDFPALQDPSLPVSAARTSRAVTRDEQETQPHYRGAHARVHPDRSDRSRRTVRGRPGDPRADARRRAHARLAARPRAARERLARASTRTSSACASRRSTPTPTTLPRRSRAPPQIADSFRLERADEVARAFTAYFHLVNLAEEHQRVRDPARARRPPRPRGRDRLGRRRVRAPGGRGRRRHRARAPAGPALPPRLHRAPDRGPPPRDLVQHPAPRRVPRGARRVAAQRRRPAPRRAADARGDRHAVAHRAAAPREAVAHRRGARGHGGLRRDAVHRGPARLPARRRRAAGSGGRRPRAGRAARSCASARGSAATATATRS